MPHLEDIWITPTPEEVAGFAESQDPRPGDEEIRAALKVFEELREARADYEILEREQIPVTLEPEMTGVVAVAATLGEGFDQASARPGLEPCLRAALAQLQAYLNYRIVKRLAPKKLHLGWPMVPGGSAAPDLTNGQVLSLLPGAKAGVRAEGNRLSPAWSMVFLYPLGPQPQTGAACASCKKDCALRK